MLVNFCVRSQGIIKSEILGSGSRPPVIFISEDSNTAKKLDRIGVTMVATAAFLSPFVSTPQPIFAFAEDGNAFDNMHSAIMKGFDAGVVLVVIFSGACWGLGHRGKALEILIGVCCGYLLARHAVDIRDFLKGI